MPPDPSTSRPAWFLGWAAAFALAVDVLADGPPGLGAAAAAGVAAVGLIVVGRLPPRSLAFLIAGLTLMAWTVIRASLVLAAVNIGASVAFFALCAAFARAGNPLTTDVGGYVARATAWISCVGRGTAMLAAPLAGLLPGRHRSVAPRAILIAVPVGLVFIILLSSADAVFAAIVRAPIDALPISSLPGHAAVVGSAAVGFAAVLARSLLPVPDAADRGPVVGDLLRTADRLALLATVDLIFAVFVGVQLVAFFRGRTFVLHHAGLSFAEYARTGFWQMLLAAGLTGLLLVATWIAGPPFSARARFAYRALACAMIGLSLIVLASAFHRLVLYEAEYGYTWPRLIPHLAILLTGALLACGSIAIVTGQTRWLPTAAIVLGLIGLLGLNAFDPERFIAHRNLARAAAGYELDTAELASLSADATPAIVAALPTVAPRTRAILERDLACLRSELVAVERFGWGSFNMARDAAARRLATLDLPAC